MDIPSLDEYGRAHDSWTVPEDEDLTSMYDFICAGEKLDASWDYIPADKRDDLKHIILSESVRKRNIPEFSSKEIIDFCKAYRAYDSIQIKHLGERSLKYPLNNLAVDVLVERGLVIERDNYLKQEAISNLRDYHILFRSNLSAEELKLACVHEISHIFYQVAPVFLSHWLDESLLEGAIDKYAEKVLNENPQLSECVFNRVRV